MENQNLKFIDLFCGLGGFRVAVDQIHENSKCVFSCDFDLDAQKSSEANFGEKPFGDITKIPESEIPAHDILFADFPCQAFSICGDERGFAVNFRRFKRTDANKLCQAKFNLV